MAQLKTHEIAKRLGDTPIQMISYKQYLIALALQGAAAQLIADENYYPTALDKLVNAAVAIADETLTALAHEATSNQ